MSSGPLTGDANIPLITWLPEGPNPKHLGVILLVPIDYRGSQSGFSRVHNRIPQYQSDMYKNIMDFNV